MFGDQSTEDRIKQVKSISEQLLCDLQKITEKFTSKDIPGLLNLEVRQKANLGIQLELFSIYAPGEIGPNVKLILEKVEAIEYQQFLCLCTAMHKTERSHRQHSSEVHRAVNEKISSFEEVYLKLPSLDFELLGDASERREDLLGDI